MMVLGAVVTGCDGARRYDSRLVAADSLMRDHPDSALALVEAVGRDSLADEGDRAYRDLLLTQARYRCYVTATSDSAINRALAWFSAHPSEREKLTRALIYKGAVMDELHHPDSAMLYYKQAEATAAPDDYFNLGYINLRIGILYQSILYNDSAVVSRMKTATRYFELIGDTSMMITTIGNQGLYKHEVGKDSAFYYLERAIKLGKELNSSNRFFFQSKLAAYYFYDKNYCHAKNLAIDIIANGKEACEENTFYYYAARSYIKLNHIDSALWVKSLIPEPLDAVDSMNHHLLLGELAQAADDYRGYAYHKSEADKIDKHIMKSSLANGLSNTELNFDTRQRESKQEKEHQFNIIRIALAFLLIAAILITCGIMVLRKMNRQYEKQLKDVQENLKKLIVETEQKSIVLESELKEHQIALGEKELALAEANKRCQELENEQKRTHDYISRIAMSRQTALNELYQNIRIESQAEDNEKRYLPIAGIFKMFNHRIKLHTNLQQSFWDNLKVSVDGEFNGIAAFVEQNYPNFSEKEMHLFLLLCTDLPNQIIKLCMGYTSDVTVSKNKKKLIKERIGLDVTFEEFRRLYLNGKLDIS